MQQSLYTRVTQVRVNLLNLTCSDRCATTKGRVTSIEWRLALITAKGRHDSVFNGKERTVACGFTLWKSSVCISHVRLVRLTPGKGFSYFVEEETVEDVSNDLNLVWWFYAGFDCQERWLAWQILQIYSHLSLMCGAWKHWRRFPPGINRMLLCHPDGHRHPLNFLPLESDCFLAENWCRHWWRRKGYVCFERSVFSGAVYYRVFMEGRSNIENKTYSASLWTKSSMHENG